MPEPIKKNGTGKGRCHLSELREALAKAPPSTRRTLSLRAKKGAAKALEGTRYQVAYTEEELEKLAKEAADANRQ